MGCARIRGIAGTARAAESPIPGFRRVRGVFAFSLEDLVALNHSGLSWTRHDYEIQVQVAQDIPRGGPPS